MDRAAEWTPDRITFRSISESLGLLGWICETDGYCIYLSPAWHEVTGTDDGEGMNWLNALHPEDRVRTSRAFFEASEKQGRYSIEYRLVRPDNTYTWAIAQGGPYFVGGTYTGMFGITTTMDQISARTNVLQGNPDDVPRTKRLTSREREVLSLIAEGKTNENIADGLKISPKTVAVHTNHAVSKLGAANRTHAVVLALRFNEL